MRDAIRYVARSSEFRSSQQRTHQVGLLTEGAYRVVRHPRYLVVSIQMVGFAFIVNYTGVYVLMLLVLLALYLIAVLEERELVDRFGEEYREHQRQVPWLIPRFRKNR